VEVNADDFEMNDLEDLNLDDEVEAGAD